MSCFLLRRFRVLAVLGVAAAGLMASQGAQAATFNLTPTADAIAYQFLPTTPVKGIFPDVLGSGFTGSGHDIKSLVRFDVSSTGLTAGQVSSATLNLFVVPTESTGFGVSPSGALPVNVDVSKLGPGFWLENSVAWNTAPAAVGGVLNSASISAVNQWIQIDVTSLVQDWLTTPAGNNGLQLTQPGPRVQNGSGTAVVGVFNSLNGGAQELFIQIDSFDEEGSSVPEPAAVVPAVLALAAFGVWKGRRWRSQRRMESLPTS